MVSSGAGCRLLALLLAVLMGAARACDDDHFTCDNGQCTMPYLICDGVTDCDDGSDEKPGKCDSAAAATLSVGDALLATVQYRFEHKGVVFRLCNDSWCSALYVWGANSNGTLKYFQDTDCNVWGAYCSSSIESQTDGWEYFPTSELAFVLERRSTSLALWRLGDIEHSVSVPVTADSHHLRIRPENWMKDMPVTLNVSFTTVTAPPSTGRTSTSSGMTTPISSTPSPSAANFAHIGFPFVALASLLLLFGR
ncbi:uncharacterized protein LOC117653585 [Thrips palmi]|uniref:Uncharacterized protein LOC117653585 n=1 Tax=Thrips palmi TaxID=161013 RepID=A0A6P9AAY6_THRPL|nr:uncharacterized protein LOC117653585 [Thrips palmi]